MKRLMGQFPAIVISAGALLVALTGFATAGPNASTAGVTPQQARLIAKSVAGAEITRRAPGLTVKSAQSATTALMANSPATYAQVTAAGVVTANARGIVQANVSHPEAGFYCFHGLLRVPKGGLAIVDSNVPGGGSGVSLVQVGVSSVRRCPSETQAHVVTFGDETGFVDDPFFVVFWF